LGHTCTICNISV